MELGNELSECTAGAARWSPYNCTQYSTTRGVSAAVWRGDASALAGRIATLWPAGSQQGARGLRPGQRRPRHAVPAGRGVCASPGHCVCDDELLAHAAALAAGATLAAGADAAPAARGKRGATVQGLLSPLLDGALHALSSSLAASFGGWAGEDNTASSATSTTIIDALQHRHGGGAPSPCCSCLLPTPCCCSSPEIGEPV